MAYFRGALRFGLKGRFYAKLAFYRKGKILCQSLLYVLNGKILRDRILHGVKPNASNLNSVIHNGKILCQTLQIAFSATVP